MPSAKLPSNVSSITVGGGTYTPSGGRTSIPSPHAELVTPGRPGAVTLVKTAANGDTTLKFPLNVTGITINAVPYTPNGSGEIVVPAVAATMFLEEHKYAK